MSIFLPAKQMLAETNEIKNRKRNKLASDIAIAMDKAKESESTEVNFYSLEGVNNTTIDLVILELRGLGYQVEYTSGQREGRYLTINWRNA